MPSRERHSRILHVCHSDKFIDPFIRFVECHVPDFDRHTFFCFGDLERFPVARRHNTIFRSDFANGLQAYLELARQMYLADKVILHGLFIFRVAQMLFAQPWLLKKCYWVIWGGDLYCGDYGNAASARYGQELIRHFVISRVGHLVTAVDGDVDLARLWYHARGVHHRCFVYTSNVWQAVTWHRTADETIRILVGNSADPTNEHTEILRMLESYRERDILVYAPLSYGADAGYVNSIATLGQSMLGDRFVAIRGFLPPEQYREFLSNIDIAIFNHRRQQALGNIVNLLGLGKKVYLRAGVTTWTLLRQLDLKAYVNTDIVLTRLDDESAAHNARIVAEAFSEDVLAAQLGAIFEG